MKGLHLAIVFSLSVSMSACGQSAKQIDWNDAELTWSSYHEGMARLTNGDANGVLVIYTDWCPTCKAYSDLFRDPDVVASLEDLVLIRSNKDEEPDISKRYDYDGEYIPRTFALTNDGKLIESLYPQQDKYRYFLPAEDKSYLIEFAEWVKQAN